VALQATVERKTAELWAANTRLEDEIAERKRSEQLRQQLESSLADSQRLEAIGRLAAGVAHEINTPTQYVGDNIQFLAQNLGPMLEVLEAVPAILAGRADDDGGVRDVLAQLERIDIGFLKEEVPAALSQSQDGVARIACIVRAMKEFSHPGTKEFVDFDLNHALQSTLTVGRSEWKYIAQVELDLDPNLPKVPCLPGEINQVLLNVLVNASHAVKSRMQVERERPGVIRIGTRVRAGHVEVAISDNGCGIPKEHFKRIFEPFFTTKPVGTGTGQGLAMAWSVVVGKHGGGDRRDERGRRRHDVRAAHPDQPPGSAAAGARGRGVPMKRILFVDDDSRVLAGIRRLLYSHRGEWRIECAASPVLAMELLAREPIDVVISDLQMPGIDGASLLEYAQRIRPAAARIVLSGEADPACAARVARVAHMFLPKPCGEAALVDAITRALVVQELLGDDWLRGVVGGIGSLPAAPRMYHQLEQGAGGAGLRP
jgi:signal transduction histidine kinase/CheY-like chemotaxis protein